MPSPRFERLRRWGLPAALLAIAPKCALCAVAYTGLGTALGLGGPELCGATDNPASLWNEWLLSAGAVTLFVAWQLLRRRHSQPSAPS